MNRDRILGALGRMLLHFSPSPMRRWIWEKVWWRAFNYTSRTVDNVWMQGNTTDLIQRYVYYFGEWEPTISRWFREHLRAGDIVVDVGANVGWYSLLAAKYIGPTGQVIAVEASPTIAAQLRGNLAKNPSLAPRVTVHNCAAGDVEGEISLYLGLAENRGSTTIHGGAGMVLEGVVPMRPLANILNGIDLNRIRAIKIDVEGAEPQVLAGLLPIMSKLASGTALIVEIAPARRGSALSILQEGGFACAGLFPNLYKADAYLAGRHEPFIQTTTLPPTEQWDVLFTRL